MGSTFNLINPKPKPEPDFGLSLSLSTCPHDPKEIQPSPHMKKAKIGGN
jgi:hypothetical protein